MIPEYENQLMLETLKELMQKMPSKERKLNGGYQKEVYQDEV